MDAKLLSYIKNQLVLDYPFYADLLLKSEIVVSETVTQTAATDGFKIFVNPKFFASITPKEAIGVMAHEVLHKVFMHVMRLGERTHKRWNAATDYVINPIILENGMHLPAGHLYDRKYVNWSADKVYNDLPEEKGEGPEGNSYYGKGGKFGNDHMIQPPYMSPAEQEEYKNEIQQQIAKAAVTAKEAGKLTGALAKLVNEMLAPQVAWQDMLRDFMVKRVGASEQTYSRLNRKFINSEVYLPSYRAKKTPPIIVMFDTSGSIYGYESAVKAFSSEIKAIIEDVCPEETHIMYVDTEVKKHDIFEDGEELEISLVGGGGTDFRTFFEKAKGIEHAGIIAFTDLYADGIPEEWDTPLMWVLYGKDNGNTKIGEKIELRETKAA